MAPHRLQGVDVRSAVPSDATDIAALLGQVGAPVEGRRIAARLEHMSRDSAVLVATEFHPIIGVLAMHWSWGVASDAAHAWIDVLVVDSQDRGRGIGRLLLKSASRLARTAGCDELGAVVGVLEEGGAGFLDATGFTRAGQMMSRGLRRRGGPRSE